MESVEDEDDKGDERPMTKAGIDEDGKGEEIRHHPPNRECGNQPRE